MRSTDSSCDRCPNHAIVVVESVEKLCGPCSIEDSLYDRPVSIQNSHGHFSAQPAAVDYTIGDFLPTSIHSLRRAMEVRGGMPYGTYEDVETATELLVMLASVLPEDHPLAHNRRQFPIREDTR